MWCPGGSARRPHAGGSDGVGSGEAKGCVFRVRGFWRPCPYPGSTLPWLNPPPPRSMPPQKAPTCQRAP